MTFLSWKKGNSLARKATQITKGNSYYWLNHWLGTSFQDLILLPPGDNKAVEQQLDEIAMKLQLQLQGKDTRKRPHLNMSLEVIPLSGKLQYINPFPLHRNAASEQNVYNLNKKSQSAQTTKRTMLSMALAQLDDFNCNYRINGM